MFELKIEQEFIQHALDEYPNEACGLIVDDGKAYIPFKNIDANPRLSFKMNAPLFFDYYKSGRVSALMHSHVHDTPFKNNFPSATDMSSQEQMRVPWGIVHISGNKDIDGPFYFGDQIPIAPLEKRDFRPNVYDCYTLLRDHYRMNKNITLPVFPREGLWWKDKKNILEQNFSKAGFKQIDRSQLQVDDVMLGSILAHSDHKIINHVMIVRDNGLILHHLNKRLSRHDPIQLYLKHATIFLRYDGGKK